MQAKDGKATKRYAGSVMSKESLVRINLMDGKDIILDADLDKIEAAYKRALVTGGPLRINTEVGSVILNPQQVSYIETPDVVVDRNLDRRRRYE